MDHTHKRKDNLEGSILPTDKKQALDKLVKITEQLLALSHRETQALVQNDIVTFAIMQQEKDLLSQYYAKASSEFRARLQEFRGTDRAVLDRLEALQNELGAKARSNNSIVEKMFSRARDKTQPSLLTIQELAQKKPVHIENEQQEGA